MSKEFRDTLVEKLKNIVKDNQNVLNLSPESIDLIVNNDDLLSTNEGTVLKYNIPKWSIPIFEKHLPIIRKSLKDSRTYPMPRIRGIAQFHGKWYITMDQDNLSLITYLKIDDLCSELEKSMRYSGFSLVSVILAMGMLSVITLQMMSLTRMAGKNTNTMNTAFDIITLSESIKSDLVSTLPSNKTNLPIILGKDHMGMNITDGYRKLQNKPWWIEKIEVNSLGEYRDNIYKLSTVVVYGKDPKKVYGTMTRIGVGTTYCLVCNSTIKKCYKTVEDANDYLVSVGILGINISLIPVNTCLL